MEIAFLGDTMNTAARLLEACRDTGQRVLASAALVNCLAALPPGVAKCSIGQLRLRGKENEIELYALTAAVSAIRGSSEVTASVHSIRLRLLSLRGSAVQVCMGRVCFSAKPRGDV